MSVCISKVLPIDTPTPPNQIVRDPSTVISSRGFFNLANGKLTDFFIGFAAVSDSDKAPPRITSTW